MNLIILCMFSVLPRHLVHSHVNTISSENLTPKLKETLVKEPHSTPLIFNQRTEQLNELSVDEAEEKCQQCLIACPANAASQPNLEQFNEEFSISKRSIFDKNVVNEDHEYAENKIESANVCKESFRPSMVFDRIMNTYNVGYELYYEKGDAKMECRKYDEFTSIKENLNKKEKRNVPVQKTEDSSIVVRAEMEDQTVFIFNSGPILMFCWIPVLSFKIDSSKHQIRVNFKNDSSNEYEVLNKCNDYSLGSELYQSENDVNFYYSKPENMFEKLDVLPLLKHPEKQAVGSVERIHIMPTMFLHTKAARLATCTYMNTALVWSTIAEGQLKLIDRYLYTIFKMWSPNVNIIFGVSDVLEVKMQDAEVKEVPKSILSFLSPDPNKPVKIKIPKLIYRVIEYHTVQDGVQKTSYIVIVVHNHPHESVTLKDRICEYPVAGWNVILNNDAKKGLSYACPLLTTVNRKLGALDKDDYPNGFHGTIHLEFMPPKSMIGTTSEDYTNVASSIKDNMKKLFPDQEIPEN